MDETTVRSACITGGRLHEGETFFVVSSETGVTVRFCDKIVTDMTFGRERKVVSGDKAYPPCDCYLFEREALAEGVARFERRIAQNAQESQALLALVRRARSRLDELVREQGLCPFEAPEAAHAATDPGEVA